MAKGKGKSGGKLPNKVMTRRAASGSKLFKGKSKASPVPMAGAKKP